MRSILLTACILSCAVSADAARADRLLSQEQAISKAVSILLRPPYGSDYLTVVKRVQSATLDHKSPRCGNSPNQLWDFHVMLPAADMPPPSNSDPIDGHLIVDAVTGKMACASLPLLD